MQETLLRLSSKPDPCDELDPCRQDNGKPCPAHCKVARFGRKILRGVVVDRLRRFRKEPRSGQSEDLDAPVVDPHDNLDHDTDAWQTFRSELLDILWLIEPTMPEKQAKVTQLIVGGMRSIKAIAEAMGQEVKDTRGLLRRLGKRIERLRPRANSRASKRLRK